VASCLVRLAKKRTRKYLRRLLDAPNSIGTSTTMGSRIPRRASLTRTSAQQPNRILSGSRPSKMRTNGTTPRFSERFDNDLSNQAT
jgi:hypothetical protein